MKTRLLTELDVFSEVARLRNFRQAADVLGIAPPTLSRRIAALERELGTVLIRRSTRSFALTYAGESLYRHAQLILRQTVRAREELRADKDDVTGSVRLGAPVDLITALFTPMLAQFCSQNPNVALTVLGTQNQPDLKRDSLDVAFAVAHQARPKDSAYAMHPVGSFPRLLYGSDKYLQRQGTPSSPEEISAHACIRHCEASAEQHWELVRGKRRQRVPVQGRFACTSVSACAQAAREGLGLVMLPVHLASHPAYGMGLTRVLPEWEGVPAYVFALTAERAAPLRVSTLIRLVQKHLPGRLKEVESTSK